MPSQADASDQNVQTKVSGNQRSDFLWQTGARFALFGLIVNVLLATAKIFAGAIGHAYVLIADGIESALDVGGSIVIWGGLTVAARPPDQTHPYGHGKAEPIAAIIVAVGVTAAAFGLAVQSVREIFLPHHAPAPWTLAVLVVAVTIKESLYRYAIRFGRKVESTAVKTDAWHHRMDAMTSIAAFIGISVA
ncbi:MAG TPA: cation diffusion facilitator family transporter, partial [Candidatus Acidoferrum sp.]|nr:cation diffusion facilitator family transporter [Candidatus Acidoferrum sp.]